MDQKASGTEWSERPSTILDFFFAFLENFEYPWIKTNSPDLPVGAVFIVRLTGIRWHP